MNEAATDDTAEGAVIEVDIPARLDRLPWSRFHTLVIAALGITWILDGLEVTLAGSVSGALKGSPSLHLDDQSVGLAASIYLMGAVAGALFFGWLTDRLGRKKLFNVTLTLYLAATAATAFSWDFYSFALFRFLTGAGIGGEYTAINSAIQELIPARYRGRTDLIVNGSFWLGAGAGAGGAALLLAPGLFGPDLGWRVCFGIGAVLSFGILFLRRMLPESPRWLMTHGEIREAEAAVAEIEARVETALGRPLPKPEDKPLRLKVHHGPQGLLRAARALFRDHRRTAVLGLVLMAAQAFFYNAIFFTYPLVLQNFYQVAADRLGLYILPFALGNFLGPLTLGPFFDILGRKPMIAGSFVAAGAILAVVTYLFVVGDLTAFSQTLGWTAVFFFASAAASSAYLTVSEGFPLELRALAIALFYAIGTAVGGVTGPFLFSHLIATRRPEILAYGYGAASAVMIVAALVEAAIGLKSERRSLESVARPLSSAEDGAA